MSQSMNFLRKNQKAILAVSGVLIIIVFTVGGALQQFLDMTQRSAGMGTTVVSWKGGRVSEQEMMHMVQAHNLANVAVRQIAMEALQKGAEPHGFDVMPMYGRFGIDPQRSEDAVVRVMVLADKARTMGLSVSDDTVRQFLEKLSGGQFKQGDIKKILHDTLGDRMSITQFFEQMKVELLAQNMLFLSRTGIYAMPPSETYAYFERLNRQAQVETMPVNVADFIDQVTGTPSRPQMQELYDKYKNYVAVPQMPEPGFRVPRKVAIEFVKVDFGKLVDEEKAKITEEQIKAEYDKRIAAGEFKVPKLPDASLDFPATKPEEKTPEKTDPATPPSDGDKKPAEEKATEPKPEDKPVEPKPEEKAVDPKAEPKPEDKPAEPKPEAPKTEDKPAEPKPEGSQLSVVCVTAQDEAAPATDEKKDEKKADAPAAEPKPEEKPADPKSEPKPEAKPAEEKPATDPAQPSTVAPATPDQPQFQPLEKVRDQILTSLAREPAQKRLDEAFAAVRKAVTKHGRETSGARRNHKDNPSKHKKPDEFPLAKVAKAAGVEFESIDFIDQFQLEKDHEIGKTSARSAGRFGNSLPFTSSAYDPKRDVYIPEQVNAMFSQMEYLYWLTDSKADYVPEFKDCEKEIVKAWKVIEARKLAKAEAEHLAKEVTTGKTLKESFLNRTVTESALFTWLSQGFTPYGMGEPQLSDVKGVEFAGMDFMKQVFAMKVGETGVAPNQPESVYYVVRLVKTAPDDALLRELFVGGTAQRSMQSIYQIWRRERGQIEQQWLTDLEKEYTVVWQRDPRSVDSDG